MNKFIRVYTDKWVFGLNLLNNQLCQLPKNMRNWADYYYPGWFNSQDCISFADDSLVVREILDSLGLDTVAVKNVIVKRADRVSSLNLYNRGIDHLPSIILKLTALKSLILINNRLKEIPEEIDQLNRLRGLYLTDNEIIELPESISDLVNLKYLFVNYNHLSDIPNRISNLSYVVTDFDYNHLCNLSNKKKNWLNLHISRLDWEKRQFCPLSKVPAKVSDVSNHVVIELSKKSSLLSKHNSALSTTSQGKIGSGEYVYYNDENIINTFQGKKRSTLIWDKNRIFFGTYIKEIVLGNMTYYNKMVIYR